VPTDNEINNLKDEILMLKAQLSNLGDCVKRVDTELQECKQTLKDRTEWIEYQTSAAWAQYAAEIVEQGK
jgi:predicted  nucleic acid-binding Zn-ribbon protein